MRTEDVITPSALSRRSVLKSGLAAMIAGSLPAFAFPPEAEDEELVPFKNAARTGEHRLDWETLSDWLTPQGEVFDVQHYGVPEFDPQDFELQIDGLVTKPMTLTMEAIRALPARDQLMTLECSGNGSSKGFMNAIYNSKWTGAALGPILEECGVKPSAREIVFFGMDTKEETLREGTGRELKIEVPFGRSLSIEEAFGRNLLLAYQRNDEPLEKRNGAPLRLIVPGYYGIANVKWLTRIEVRDRRYMGRYMARDYVTVRGERQGKRIVNVESSVGRMNLKSVVARVTRRPTDGGKIPLKACGAAWGDGTEITKVEVKLDDGKWQEAKLDSEPRAKYSWVFFSIDLGPVGPGEHTLVSRATDASGRVQPSAKDDEIALKKTYWEAYEQWPRELEVEA